MKDSPPSLETDDRWPDWDDPDSDVWEELWYDPEVGPSAEDMCLPVPILPSLARPSRQIQIFQTSRTLGT